MRKPSSYKRALNISQALLKAMEMIKKHSTISSTKLPAMNSSLLNRPSSMLSGMM